MKKSKILVRSRKTTKFCAIYSVCILLFIASLLSMGCPQQSTSSTGNDSGITAKKYSIGNIGPSGVGIVFYITDGGLHGLEAAPSLWNGGAADPTSVWSNIDSVQIGVTAQGTAIGTGQANSNAVITQSGHTESAVKLCRDYNGGGKTDWFLPSINELAEMQTVLASTPGNRTTYGFAESAYWSSSEVNASQSWYEGFTLGITANDAAKLNHMYVRAIRAF